VKEELLKLETNRREPQIAKFSREEKERAILSPDRRLLIFSVFYGGSCTKRS